MEEMQLKAKCLINVAPPAIHTNYTRKNKSRLFDNTHTHTHTPTPLICS